jgi:hypothetical protein
VGPYAGVILVCSLIWLVTSISSGEFVYFWPGWMMIPLLFGLIGRFANRIGRRAFWPAAGMLEGMGRDENASGRRRSAGRRRTV